VPSLEWLPCLFGPLNWERTQNNLAIAHVPMGHFLIGFLPSSHAWAYYRAHLPLADRSVLAERENFSVYL
jgi:hypothetical protein